MGFADILDSPVIRASDIFLGILVNLSKKFVDPQKLLSLRCHGFRLQGIFSRLKMADQKYKVMEPFVFSDAGPEPYCPILQESVDHLVLGGCISRPFVNDWEVLVLLPAGEKFFEELGKQRFSPEELAEIEDIADYIYTLGIINRDHLSQLARA